MNQPIRILQCVTIMNRNGLENRLMDRVERLYELRNKIEDAMERLSSDQRLLLRYRYIEGMTWESVCVKMHYSWKQIHRIHAKILRILEDDTQ